MPVLGGRSVPIWAAVVPALGAAILVTNAGLMYVRMVLTTGGFRLGEGTVLRLNTDPAALAPELLWPIWGVALAATALAYYYRRRGVCPHGTTEGPGGCAGCGNAAHLHPPGPSLPGISAA